MEKPYETYNIFREKAKIQTINTGELMHVKIRPLKIEDALISYKWRNNPKIWEYTYNRPDKEITSEIEIQWLKRVLKKPDEKRFAIIADGKYVGNTQLTNITNEYAVLHIFIGETDYWGKNVASEAVALLIEYAKNELNLSEIYLEVNNGNKSAINLYKKLKFEFIPFKTRTNWQIMYRNLLMSSFPPPERDNWGFLYEIFS